MGRGHLPPDFRGVLRFFLPTLDPSDYALIAQPLDFLGANYYTRTVLRYNPTSPVLRADYIFPAASEFSHMWEVYPQGLSDALSTLWQNYITPLHPNLRLFITENGAPMPERRESDGRISDPRRTRYLFDHLKEVRRAIAAGVPIEGYFVWSLLDNFEWTYGYRMRFGLIHVDFDTQQRTVKDSGHWYSAVAAANRLLEP